MKRYKTPEQIAADADHLDGLANIRAINSAYRAQDESGLWPISGKFNATERAIRQARKFQQANGTIYGYEYSLTLDQLISDIVNSPNL